LPESVRGKMEAALGANFVDVRVHVGPQAERIGAIAFTIGSDIYFAPGRYQPDSVHGQQLLGHELAHVVQQRAGRVRNPMGSGIAVVQDHALEAEADRLGRRAASAAPMLRTSGRANLLEQVPSTRRPHYPVVSPPRPGEPTTGANRAEPAANRPTSRLGHAPERFPVPTKPVYLGGTDGAAQRHCSWSGGGASVSTFGQPSSNNAGPKSLSLRQRMNYPKAKIGAMREFLFNGPYGITTEAIGK
jgi:hypothetical protein